MLSGHILGSRESTGSEELLLENPVSELDDDDLENSKQILYTASFDDLARNHLQYETILWVGISIVLVLAWGIGILMLLYLPVRRYVLQKDISTRKLYVTPSEIVFKVRRPIFLPFLGVKIIDKRIPLTLVINIIIEQGCLQSMYGIHTFRIESIAHGKAAAMDELLVQGVSNPKLLKKVILTEASKLVRGFGRSGKPTFRAVEGESLSAQGASENKGSILGRSLCRSSKEIGGGTPGDLVLLKLEEVDQTVKKIESLVQKSQVCKST